MVPSLTKSLLVALGLPLVAMTLCITAADARRKKPAAVAPPADTPRPAPAPAEDALPPGDWQDWPFTPGEWVYRRDARGSIALFGPLDQNAVLTVRCDLEKRSILFSRAGDIGDGSVQMRLRTSFGPLQWPAQDAGGSPHFAVAVRSPSDGGLDKIAFSRGRFTVEIPGRSILVLRPWAEPIRVFEDCRGN